MTGLILAGAPAWERLVEDGDLDLLDDLLDLGGHDVEVVAAVVGHADDEDDDEEVDDEVVSVDVTVLYFAGCPSWQTAVERVHAAAGQGEVEVAVSLLAVETQQDADRLGFTGSPTIWLDGTDPFESADAAPALACRVYPTPTGLAGSPTVEQLADALAAHHV